MENLSSKTLRLTHLVQQLRLMRRLTVRQVAEEMGVPRSSLARHFDLGAIPQNCHDKSVRWIAEHSGAPEAAVTNFVEGMPDQSASIALLELGCARILALNETKPQEIAKILIRRWQAARVSIVCMTYPPLFLIPGAIRNSTLKAIDPLPNIETVEQIRHLHRIIAGQIALHAELLPHEWELILSHRAIAALCDRWSPQNYVLRELAENWQHDLYGQCGLQIRVMPDNADARAVERHFADAAAVVLVDGVFRWKESADHQQVSVVGDEVGESMLRWDREVIDLARTLATDAVTASPKSIEQSLGVQIDDQNIRHEIDAQRMRSAA